MSRIVKTRNDKGQPHSFDDKPAIVYDDGRKEWYRNGKKHRDNDLPAVIRGDGVEFFYRFGRQSIKI